MFAVPGWSVSSTSLKTQTLSPSNPTSSTTTTTTTTAPSTDQIPAPAKPHKKRSRNSGKSKTLGVNSANLADLWETVIEKKAPKPTPENASGEHKKRQRNRKSSTTEKAQEDGAPKSSVEEVDADAGSEPAPKKRKTKEKKERGRKEKGEKDAALEPSKDSTTTPATLPPPKPTAQLTPLQISMRQKLISARFRHLNQALYTTPSARSMELFQESPEMFNEYHEGFRRQVEVWPENPVDGYIQQIKTRGKQRGPMRGKPAAASSPSAATPLPRTDGTSHIADLGCGDAGLALGLQKDLKALKLQIHSFDLQSPSPLVTRADIANLPLADDSVDVAIFCLALMGTNWVDFIEEAFRVLRWKGELWVAEIKSRFGRVGGPQKRVDHSVGNRVKKPDKKVLKRQEEELDEKDLAVEVDGHDDNKQETDVSAFVEVLRKRGFVLQGEPDLQNKMFVRMRFVKGLTPVKGKGVPLPKGMADMGVETWQKKPKGKFIDEDIAVSSEASVLKPCVYKLR